MSDLTFGAVRLRAAPRHQRLLTRAAGLARSAGRLVWLMLARSRERRVLASLDARGLRDIGITPAEAGAEARKWIWQR